MRDLAQAGGQATSDKFVDERIAGSLWALGSEAVAYAPEPTIHMVSWVDAERGLVVVQMRGGTFIDLTRLLNDLRLVDDAEWEAMVAQYPSTGPVTATTIPQETP